MAWLGLLVIFTYTPIIAAIFVKNGNIVMEYFNMQHQAISLFVNMGLIGMVLIDYFTTSHSIDRYTMCLIFIGILALFVIYVHTGIIYNGKGGLYTRIINNKWLSFVAHVVLLFVVGIIKYLSMNKPEPYIVAEQI